MDFEKAKEFVKKTARPLDQALFRFFFEDGTKAAVLNELRKYQNEDGGFGHGLEPDNFNVNSSPITTNDALIMLHRLDAFSEAEDIVQGMVCYLNSHDSFDEEKERWLFAIDSNMNYPHAIWWEKEGDGIENFNPSVSLAAFLLCFGKAEELYVRILRDSILFLQTAEKIGGDDLKCYLLAYSLLRKFQKTEYTDLDSFRDLISHWLWKTICKDTEKYGVEYVASPADFFSGIYTEFITPEIQILIDMEKNVLSMLQKEDGGYDISWQWHTPYPEFFEAREEWRGRITVEKMLYDRSK